MRDKLGGFLGFLPDIVPEIRHVSSMCSTNEKLSAAMVSASYFSSVCPFGEEGLDNRNQ